MMQPEGFQILLEDGPCWVVSKPGGLLTQAPPYLDSLERRVKEFIKVRDQKPGKVYLGVPHRLDRPVSGVLVLARHVRAARRTCEQFEGRTVGKTYWAVVEGTVEPDAGTWRDYVRKIPGVAQAECVAEEHPDARLAELSYRVLGATAGLSWLEIQLATGRMHQIRLQAARRGWPVLGDALYGAHLPFGPQTDEPRDRWIALHARQLAFRHPMTREPLQVTAPLSAHWAKLSAQFRPLLPEQLAQALAGDEELRTA